MSLPADVTPARWSQDEGPGHLLAQSWWNAQAQAYRVRISIGGTGLAWELDDQRATRYARAVLRAAGVAIHDAAIFHQLVAHKVDGVAAAQLVAEELHPGRRRWDDQGTAPLQFRPHFDADTLSPMVRMDFPAQPELDYHRAMLEAAAATGHAVAVLEVAAVVELDTAYQAALVRLGMHEHRARALVDDLPRFRQDAGGDAHGRWRWMEQEP